MDNNYYGNNNEHKTIINGQVYNGEQTDEQVNLFTKVFGWMFVGLIVTTFFTIFGRNMYLRMIEETSLLIVFLVFIQIGLVAFISARVHKMSFITALGAFLFYAALNGITLSWIFLEYAKGTIYGAFGVTALLFGIMAIIGTVTKKDLSAMGNFAMMALIGIIIASVANIFLKSDGISWLLTYVGVLVFVALTAYDVQKIKKLSDTGRYNTNQIAILGALTLYLDFINLFIRILRILGKKSND